ncbi:MAG TPA: hypothetical protein VNX28_04650 [Gemmataceae bacterium]|nr:hypothetical protein [Gemmataceae bacterium]
MTILENPMIPLSELKPQLTYWLLDGQKLPDSIPPEHRPDDVDDLFAAVRAKYPPDPLEEEE